MTTQAQKKAAEARQLLENPRLIQAFENVKNNIVANLESVPVNDEPARLQLVVSLQVLKAIQKDIQNDITDNVVDISSSDVI